LFYLGLKHKEKIGTTKIDGGLYVLNNAGEYTHNSKICNTVSRNFWQDRLGHLSNDRLAILKLKCPYIQYNKVDNCSTCHFSKQRRLPFPKNDSRVSKSFDIIHADIWGHVLYPLYMNIDIFSPLLMDIVVTLRYIP